MTADNSVLVPYELRDVGPDAAPYPADAIWAEPDRHAAASSMRPSSSSRTSRRASVVVVADDLTPLAADGAGAEWLVQRYQDVTQTRIF